MQEYPTSRDEVAMTAKAYDRQRPGGSTTVKTERRSPNIVQSTSELRSHINQLELRLRSFTMRMLGSYRPPEPATSNGGIIKVDVHETMMQQFYGNLEAANGSVTEMELMVTALENQI